MSREASLPSLWDQPASKPARKPRRKPFAETSRAALDVIAPHVSDLEARILAFVAERGPAGATRQEIAERLPLEINVVCGRVDHLLELGVIFEPLREGAALPTPDHRGRYPKGCYQQRDGRKFVVAARYLSHYPGTPAPATRAA